MGHHHRRQATQNQEPSALTTGSQDMNISSMLNNMNLGGMDLSKVDLGKVQAIMNQMKAPAPQNSFGPSSNQGNNQQLNIWNALKDFAPAKKTKKLNKLVQLLQITNALNNNGTSNVSQPRRSHRK